MDRQHQEHGAHLLALDSPTAVAARPEPAWLGIAGIGLLAPGFSSWTEAEGVLTGLTPYRDRGLPPLERLRLPPSEARRLSLSVRIALEAAEEATADAHIATATMASVFACSGGNAESLHKVLESLAERSVSPNQFAQMSHHAAAAGWSLISGRAAPTNSIGSFDGSFSAGLLEASCIALAEHRPVLLVTHDVPPPSAFRARRQVTAPFALALLLTDMPAGTLTGRLQLNLTRRRDETRLEDPGLEALRLNNPAARALPLLRLIAANQSGRAVLPYLQELRLDVRYLPC
jgi:hypothetical protein